MFPSQKCGNRNHPVHAEPASMGPGCFHPRNMYGGSNAGAAAFSLQWGRDVSIPEMLQEVSRHPGFVRFNGAGMFPSQKLEYGSGRYRLMLASMGPGCFHPRNGGMKYAVSLLYRASMGPGCFHPRNTMCLMTFMGFGGLQWGRDVSIPEMPKTCRSARSICPASMGPGCFHPRNKCLGYSLRSPGVLQWGRDVSIPEMITLVM